MTDLIDTTEMYLRTILELEEEGQVPMRARISERLQQSGPTVSQTVARMERDGLVKVSDDRHLELTDTGRSEAVAVMRKHRLAERLLADVIGLDWELVHEEACRWEHVMSETVERKILELIRDPHLSPYGNPIPGLEELGLGRSEEFTTGVESIAALDQNALKPVYKLVRIGEPLQVDTDLLVDLKEQGILPGANVNICHDAGRWIIWAEGRKDGESFEPELAMHLFVEK
ncbi:MAG: metal-dependent transcriptional regulator [Micrococcales bacterium]